MKRPRAGLLFLLAVSLLIAQSVLLPAPGAAQQRDNNSGAAAKIPTKDEVEAAMKRSFGYDPSVTWVIYDIRASAIPGLADVLISINKQNPQHIYVSLDTQTAIAGELVPFGPNPFSLIRAALQKADGPAQGAPSPTMLAVEFSDLECPHCKTAQPVLERLVADFPRVRFVFQQYPLPASMHPWAMKGAEYADCVGRLNPGAFWKYIDKVFENQGAIAAATADDKLKDIATSAGLDAQRISACAALPETDARIKKSMELGQSLDVTQTPTLFINGRRVLGIADIPYEQLKNLMQFEIDHAGK